MTRPLVARTALIVDQDRRAYFLIDFFHHKALNLEFGFHDTLYAAADGQLYAHMFMQPLHAADPLHRYWLTQDDGRALAPAVDSLQPKPLAHKAARFNPGTLEDDFIGPIKQRLQEFRDIVGLLTRPQLVGNIQPLPETALVSLDGAAWPTHARSVICYYRPKKKHREENTAALQKTAPRVQIKKIRSPLPGRPNERKKLLRQAAATN